MPKVTIITPCYNAAPYIANTIASVQRQSLTDWQYIIVDDGSTDKSYDIVADLAKSDPRITLLQQANQGSAAARNYALQYAKGQYIQFLDADDTIYPDKLKFQTQLMDQHNYDVTYTDYSLSSLEMTPKTKSRHFNHIKLLTLWGVFGTIPLHSFVYRRAFLEAHHITNTSQVKEREDWDFHIKVFAAHPRIHHLRGYCGANYFQCPTGKASNGSLTTLKLGTLRYLMYKISITSGYIKLLLLLRLSIEFVEILLHRLRQKLNITPIQDFISSSSSHRKITISSCFLLPLALPIYAYRILWALLKEKE
jgi:glycosyltransferase involved in cell wall biosynthesis